MVETQASKYAIGAVLGQLTEEGGRPQPVCYLSRALIGSELNYDANDRECLAVVAACKTWRPYLEGSKHPFQLYTDNDSLESMYRRLGKLDPYGRRGRWVELLGRYQFEVLPRQWQSVVEEDELSRRRDFTSYQSGRGRPESEGEDGTSFGLNNVVVIEALLHAPEPACPTGSCSAQIPLHSRAQQSAPFVLLYVKSSRILGWVVILFMLLLRGQISGW